ncbi:Type I inositol-1,4,5-trisphosphate 5-phosphatase CVP2 [Hordeum vulgare]|nr:Type I inositol-1,4,5-trisphosphate 5-phosphatase CVP2 [Hordeum vulgare]
MHSPTSLSSNVVPSDIPKPAFADELAKNGNKKKPFMSNIFRKKGRSGADAGTSDKRPPSRRDRDFLFDLEEKCGERAEFLDATPPSARASQIGIARRESRAWPSAAWTRPTGRTSTHGSTDSKDIWMIIWVHGKHTVMVMVMFWSMTMTIDDFSFS